MSDPIDPTRDNPDCPLPAIEVTQEMIEAGAAVEREFRDEWSPRTLAEAIYRAMYAASPERKELEELREYKEYRIFCD